MERIEFTRYRKRLKKTQRQIAQLLGTSVKAVHSYEQGWRSIPPHVERQLLFLISSFREKKHPRQHCWALKQCPEKQKKACPAWEFQNGYLCWFITGTLCNGNAQTNWQEKMTICRKCSVFNAAIASPDKL